LEVDTEKSAERELGKLHEYSEYYSRLINPKEEPEEELKSRFFRHNRWGIETAYPFLLNIYKDYSEKKILLNQFYDILDIIETVVIRRFFCKFPSNQLNKLFVGLYEKLSKNNIIDSLKASLEDECPRDMEFKQGLKTFPIYTSGKSIRTNLILETLENTFHPEVKVNCEGLQVEHIMPQSGGDIEKLPIKWREMLGEKYEEVYTNYLHTLGNMTLITPRGNSTISMYPFEEKKQFFRTPSPLVLNSYFNDVVKWDEEEIIKRSEILAKRAIETWKDISLSLNLF
jgi:hypothetical protein